MRLTPETKIITVYDKAGGAHTMNALNAWDMMTHVGWSDKPPAGQDDTAEPVEAPAPVEATVEPVIEDAPAEPVIEDAPAETPPAQTIVVDFETMDKDDLIAWAATNLPTVKIDERLGKGRILGLIREATA